MKIYSQQDFITQLTTESPSFVQILFEVLQQSGWASVELTGSVLTATNSLGKRIKVTDFNNGASLIGYRNDNDNSSYPSLTHMPWSVSSLGVGLLRNTVSKNWKLFADSISFFFYNQSKLSGFSHFVPLFDDDETCFVLGSASIDTTSQSFLVSTTQAATLLCLEGDGTGLNLSKIAGASIFYKIDDYDLKSYSTAFLLVSSPIAIHHPDTRSLRGFIPDVVAFSTTFSDEGEIFSMGGYTIYCIVVDGRCLGVRLDG